MKSVVKVFAILLLMGAIAFLIIIINQRDSDFESTAQTDNGKSYESSSVNGERGDFDSDSTSQLIGFVGNEQSLKVEVIPADTEFDSRPIPSNPGFYYPGGGSSKRAIKNPAGNIIFQGTEELPFISLRSMKDVDKIVVHSGEGRSLLIDSESGYQVALPDRPPGENMFPLWWEWIDADTLIGTSGVEALNPDGSPVTCCGGHNVAETKLYTYRISTGELTELPLPEGLAGRAFQLQPPTRDGSFQATSIHTHDGLTEEETLWLQVQPRFEGLPYGRSEEMIKMLNASVPEWMSLAEPIKVEPIEERSLPDSYSFRPRSGGATNSRNRVHIPDRGIEIELSHNVDWRGINEEGYGVSLNLDGTKLLVNTGMTTRLYEISEDGEHREVPLRIPRVTYDEGLKGWISGWSWAGDGILVGRGVILDETGHDAIEGRLYVFHMQEQALARLDLSALDLPETTGIEIAGIGEDLEHLRIRLGDREFAVKADLKAPPKPDSAPALDSPPTPKAQADGQARMARD